MLNTNCSDFNFKRGRNMGNGFGGGRRYRGGACFRENCSNIYSNPQEMREWEIKTLHQQAQYLKEAQEEIQKRIQALEASDTK